MPQLPDHTYRVTLLAVALIACAPIPPVDWNLVEGRVAAVCACKDAACVDRLDEFREGEYWYGITLAQWRSFDQAQRERGFELGTRGDLCKISKRLPEDMAKFRGFADAMCACKTRECAVDVERDEVAWAKHIWDVVNWTLLGSLLEIEAANVERYDRCQAALDPRPVSTPQQPATTSLIGRRLVEATNKLCACSSHPCAELVDHQFHTWWTHANETAYGQQLIDGSPGTKQRYLQCFDRLQQWPHGARIGN